MRRIASDNITELQDNEVFVFGSNLSGFHSAGAAKKAMDWGAVWGQGEGLQGQTYALPTKAEYIRYTLNLEKIQQHVDLFISTAKSIPEKKFLVTQVGCGLAGLEPYEVAPLFRAAMSIENIYMPEIFWDILERAEAKASPKKVTNLLDEGEGWEG